MDQQITPTTSYKEVKIGKTIYRVTSFFFGRKGAGKDFGAAGCPARHVGGFHTCQLLRTHGYIVTPSSRLCRILARRWILRYDVHTGRFPVEPSRRTRYGIWIIGRENKDGYKNIQRRHLLPFE
mgnify:CR=1 FL=1